MIRLAITAVALLTVSSAASADQWGPLVDWSQVVPSTTLQNLPKAGDGSLLEDPDLRYNPGEVCVVTPKLAISCGKKVVCRAFVGLNPNAREELWPPRREADAFICDERDRPSVGSSLDR